MIRVAIFVIGLAVALPAAARAQDVDVGDRVIAGDDNLAVLSKGGDHLETPDLSSLVKNKDLNVLVIRQRTTKVADSPTVEHSVLYVMRRETKFREKKISEKDYERLIKLLDKVNDK